MADVMERTYSAMFLYNRPKLSSNRKKDPDYVLSYRFVKFAVEKMETWGLKSYYHDHNAKPGSNIFGELFTTVNASRFIVVLCTRGFLKDAWGHYSSHAAFAKLLDQNDSKRFIAIHLDLTDPEIPEAFYTMIGLSFSANWQNEHDEWEKFKEIFVKVKQQVPATGADSVPLIGDYPSNRDSYHHLQTPHVGIQAMVLSVYFFMMSDHRHLSLYKHEKEISCIESDEPSKINSILQSVNQNTTNRSDNGTPLHQQLGTGNQHDLAEKHSNDSSDIYHRNSTHGLVSNNSANVPIATIIPLKSTTTPSQNANNQSTTQTGVGLTSSVATPPNTVTSFTERNMKENIILPHKDQSSTTMQTPDNAEPLDDAAPSNYSQNSSDTKLKEIVGRDTVDENVLLGSLNLNEEELENCDQSNSIDNQVSTDSRKTETEKGKVCSQQPDHIERSVCPNSNPQHDCGNDQGLNLQSILIDHLNTNGSNTDSIGINRVNDYIPPLPNNSDGYASMD